ncbi:acyltransferase domain-containing protein [Ochrobactrum grignonense]|nr:acyltransferase domain-containing protein [Brucella grignonensis]
MDEIKSDLLSMLHHLGPKLPQMPTWSTVTGMKVNEINFDGDYFYENVRQPVRLAAALSDLMNAGFESFIEIGPHPVLSNAIQECAASLGKTVSVVSSLHRISQSLKL